MTDPWTHLRELADEWEALAELYAKDNRYINSTYKVCAFDVREAIAKAEREAGK